MDLDIDFLEISDATAEDSGEYSLVVKYEGGELIETVMVTVVTKTQEIVSKEEVEEIKVIEAAQVEVGPDTEEKKQPEDKQKTQAPKFDLEPTPVKVEVGEVITLTCKVTGIPRIIALEAWRAVCSVRWHMLQLLIVSFHM